MTFIKNKDELLDPSKSCSKCLRARKTAVELLEEALKAADPYEAVRKNIAIDGEEIVIAGKRFKPSNIWVLGLGKASIKMALAVEDALGERISGGVIAAPKALRDRVERVPKLMEIVWSNHPIPDEDSVRAGRKLLEYAEQARENDIVLVLVSGGGSALVEYPANDITLEDIVKVTRLLLRSGAIIQEINAVRKHLSMFKGGWLAKRAYPATLVSLIISDVVGDNLEAIASGPTAPDPTTFKDAYEILRRYGLWEKIPSKPREYIEKGLRGEVPETPKPGDEVFQKVHNNIIASNIVSLKAMEAKARELGYNTLILTSLLQGEARVVGRVLASIALETLTNGYPIKPPAVILSGGETTVTVKGKGKGGRNQELALSAAIDIRGTHGIVIASMGTDGIDGVTDVAGGIVDAHSIERSLSLGLDPYQVLDNNDSYSFFNELKDAIYTGATGTNVNDVQVIVVEK